jgi:hypothetical protein
VGFGPYAACSVYKGVLVNILMVLQILEALMSSVPEAMELWNKIAPHLNLNSEISDEHVKEIKQLAPIAIEITERSRAAVKVLVDTHPHPNS